MGIPKQDLAEQSFGRLTVVTWVPTYQRTPHWICDCSCGERRIVSSDALLSGRTKSCGCLRKEPHAYKHGDKGSRLYSIWTGMKKRCHNPAAINYRDYGGRGILVCDAWKNDYPAFKIWSLANGYEPDAGLSIDRIDNDRGYEPENCRWVPRVEQNRNRRNTRWVTVHGEKMPLGTAAEKYGIPYHRLKMRLVSGLTPEDAVIPGIDPLRRRLIGTVAATAAKNAKKALAPGPKSNV